MVNRFQYNTYEYEKNIFCNNDWNLLFINYGKIEQPNEKKLDSL